VPTHGVRSVVACEEEYALSLLAWIGGSAQRAPRLKFSAHRFWIGGRLELLLDQGRHRRAGADCIDADSEAREIEGERTGERENRAFACAVGGRLGVADEAQLGARENDDAGSLVLHVRNCSLDDAEHSFYVHIEYTIPLLLAQLVERDATRDARVAEEDVELCVDTNRLLDHAGPVGH